MTGYSTRKNRWLSLAAAIATMSCNGQAERKHMDQPMPAVDEMLDRVRMTGTIDVAMVEKIIGTTLRETDDGNDSFTFYEAKGVQSGSHMIGIDLRMPVKGGGATSGPLLVFNLSGSCSHRAEVEAKYGPWTLTNAPRGGSLDEESSWSRQEPWGKLSFGFAERAPDCLSSVVFDAEK